MHDPVDGDSGQWDDGTEGEQPAEADRPAGVDVGSVRDGGVDDNAERQDKLKHEKTISHTRNQ